MLELLRRAFIVELPVEDAWRHLARIEQWPSWVKHITQITLQPPGQLGPTSIGVGRMGRMGTVHVGPYACYIYDINSLMWPLSFCFDVAGSALRPDFCK
jgi:hypothetical protein